MSSLQHIGPLCLTYINDIWLRLILSCTSLLLFQQKNAIYLSQYSYLITSEIRKCIHHWVQYIWHRASRPVTCHWILASNILDSRYPWKLMWVSKNNFIFCNQVYVAVIWVMFCQIPWKYGARGLRRIWYCNPCLLMILPRGSIYMVKRIGPNTDPWGTPQVNGMFFEFTPFIRTDCFLSERYDLNHWRATSQTPRWDCSLAKMMLLSMVSNAALKSRSNRMTHCFSSICLDISSCTEVNAVSVLWNFLYEDWNSSYRLLIFMWSCSLSATTRSINLDKKVRFETGLNFLNNSGSKHIFFSNGMRTASLRLLGITPEVNAMSVAWPGAPSTNMD